MSRRTARTRAFAREIAAARSAFLRRDSKAEFAHLERAHILGQRDTLAHVSAHWRMFQFGLRHRDFREVFAQSLRMLAALTKSVIWVPVGNTGGANVNPFRRMPVPRDLRDYLD